MKKILIIEDDPDITAIIKLALAGKYLLQSSMESQDLLVLLEEFRPDMIMIDYYIGQKKAPEIMDEIRTREIYKNLPVLLFSGHQDIKRLAAEMRASAYLAKPFNLSDLYTAVAEVLKKS